MNPEDRKYSKDHEWVATDGTIGITEFAQSELGDIVYVELPTVGASFSQGDVIGTIESVKAVSEIYAPVSGTILAVNDALSDAPDQVNTAPFGEGWYCKFELSNAPELDELLDAAAYGELIG